MSHPKSAIFKQLMSPFFASSRLSSFRSRCTTPLHKRVPEGKEPSCTRRESAAQASSGEPNAGLVLTQSAGIGRHA